MTRRFTDELRQSVAADWEATVRHRFVREVLDGTVSAADMGRYLVQDHRFVDGFLALLGAAIATADRMDARLRIARFAGEVAGEENTYFERAFAELGIGEAERLDVPDHPSTASFNAIFREAADTRSYAAALTVILVTEWIYNDWAKLAPDPLPDNFVHAEWIALHDSPSFRILVTFLRRELDRVGPAEAELCRDLFRRTTAVELRFFDEVYEVSP